MQGLETCLLPAILPGLVGSEYCQAEIIIGISRQFGCHVAAVYPRSAKPGLLVYICWVAFETDHQRPGLGKLQSKHFRKKDMVALKGKSDIGDKINTRSFSHSSTPTPA